MLLLLVTAPGFLPEFRDRDAGRLGAARPAQEVFTRGLHLAAVLGCAMFIVLAVLVAVTFRHLRPYGEQQDERPPEAEAARSARGRARSIGLGVQL